MFLQPQTCSPPPASSLIPPALIPEFPTRELPTSHLDPQNSSCSGGTHAGGPDLTDPRGTTTPVQPVAVPLLRSAWTPSLNLSSPAKRSGSPVNMGTLACQTTSLPSPTVRIILPASLQWSRESLHPHVFVDSRADDSFIDLLQLNTHKFPLKPSTYQKR